MQARAIVEIARVHAGQPRATAIQLAEEMSELLGETVSDRDVGRWLRGESSPGTLVRLWGFARILQVDPGWLAFGSESTAAEPSVLSAIPNVPLTAAPKPRGPKKR